MAWDTDLVLMLRVLTNDMAEPYKNASGYLEQVLITAGIFVQQEVTLLNTYVFDIASITMTPDPIVTGDAVAQALFPLKAACILNQGDFQKALGQTIRVRDGDSAIDTSVSLGGYKDILLLGPCAMYEKFRWYLQAASASDNFGAVLSPWRSENCYYANTVALLYDQFANALNICCGRCCR